MPFMREMLYQALFVPEGEEPFPRSILARPEIARYYENWDPDSDFGLILMVDGEYAGAMWMRLFTAENKGYGYIADTIPELSISVKPELRGKGLGTKLMRASFKQARKRGYKSLSLSVDKRNPAVRLYQRMGFITREESASSIIMKRDL